VAPGCDEHPTWTVKQSGHWYNLSVTVEELPGFSRRLAGRVETGKHSFSDAAMGGPARGEAGREQLVRPPWAGWALDLQCLPGPGGGSSHDVIPDRTGSAAGSVRPRDL
jgi:hypothetical protein